MGNTIPEAISRREAQELIEHAAQEKEREKEREAARAKEWKKHATHLERKKCIEYIEKFNAAMIESPMTQKVEIGTNKHVPTMMELACFSSAVEKVGFRSVKYDEGVCFSTIIVQ